MDMRKALEGMFYVMRTGTQWKALPKELGAPLFQVLVREGVLPKPAGRRP